ncbi:MAG: glutamate formimidoyltransferase [Anaerolineales bacterium]|nr:glutamate formimidoyltransferase [Anaerolineales bacterium]
MPNPLVECVPNFSEARRPEVIEDILGAITSVPGVIVLDRHSDFDHNRTVITFVGAPENIEEATFRAISTAAELIDLDKHSGEHPRIGATDVVPFVPISDITMEECVQMAQRLGRRVGEELNIPVYLYEQAATRPDRQNLENIRRGQYELLKEEIETNPERAPDFGPARIGTAGATVIGARPFLIAFNVYLSTDDVQIAKNIAKAVRHSSGGLRYVKGLGLLVEGRAQVSMNLTDYRKTPIARVVEMIRREATRYGVAVHHSELVGLIPQEALVDAAVWYLQLDQFDPGQVLEQKLYSQAAAQEQDGEVESYSFLDELADRSATPGGGSAAAFSAAAAAALVSMVARLTIGKKKYRDVEAQMTSILERSETLRAQLSEAVKEDAAAFDDLMAAYKLPKDDRNAAKRRDQAIQSATLKAAQVPLEVAEKALEVLELATKVVSSGNVNAITDGASGAALAQAALTAAGLNVRVNISDLEDRSAAKKMMVDLQSIETKAAKLQRKIDQVLKERGGLSD